MTRLMINDKAQSVTTLVTYHDMAGELHFILARPDPRYRDREGLSLAGKQLPVGPFQFVGGLVEDGNPGAAADAALLALRAVNSPPPALDGRITATALQELDEEIHLDAAKFIRKDASLRHMTTVARADAHTAGGQEVHYLNLHLGTLAESEIRALQDETRPDDDLIQIAHLKAKDIGRDAEGAVSIRAAGGIVKTKTAFTGFPEIEKWDKSIGDGIDDARRAGDTAREAALAARQAVYTRMHRELRGLQGVDPATLDPDAATGMFAPSAPGVKTDGQILSEFIDSFRAPSQAPGKGRRGDPAMPK